MNESEKGGSISAGVVMMIVILVIVALLALFAEYTIPPSQRVKEDIHEISPHAFIPRTEEPNGTD